METNEKKENKSKLCLSEICRTCLRQTTNLKSLFCKLEGKECTILEALSSIRNTEIRTCSELPQQICFDCELVIHKTEEFKKCCVESELILVNFLEDNKYHPKDRKTDLNSTVNEELISGSKNKVVSKCEGASENYCSDINLVEYDSCQAVKGELREQAKCYLERKDNVIFDSTKNSLLGADVKVEISLDNDFDTNDFHENEEFGICSEQFKSEGDTLTFNCGCGYVFIEKEKFETHLREYYCLPLKGNEGRLKVKNAKQISRKIKNKVKQKKNQVKSNGCSKLKDVFIPIINYSGRGRELTIEKKGHVSNLKDVNIPIANGEEPEGFQCSLCMRIFNRKSSLETHVKKHEEKNEKHTCTTCKRDFVYKAHLDNHILAVHTREKGFSCDVCSKSFSTSCNLEIHKESHKIKKNHKCRICDKSFVMLSALCDHERTHTGERPFLCSTCGKGFSQKNNLKQHIRRHQGLKPFKCEECVKSFVSKGELVAHKRHHSGAHPFICDDCGSGFTTSSSLVKHRRIHTGERPYACDLCPMRFSASGTLRNHRRTHTNERPHSCPHCEKAFIQKQDLTAHIRCHTGERPFICAVCSQSFRKASALKIHSRSHSKTDSMLGIDKSKHQHNIPVQFEKIGTY